MENGIWKMVLVQFESFDISFTPGLSPVLDDVLSNSPRTSDEVRHRAEARRE